ncbi:YaaR family protein [uncultured Treponema sp.]|uniref:YaaR family protein n=1 Tax=uncultured Treponema sp. TaxID=162155 RepID=UPI0025F0C418|nr:YaaR family protein [uncultured Treponema sp.]
MAEISSVNSQLNSQSLYFAATQAASQQMAQQAKKTEKKEKSAFAMSLSHNQEKAQLMSEGLPVELAGMSQEEAIVFLKDEMDMAGDELKARQSLEAMEKYRKRVSQFMKFVVKNNFEFIRKKRFGRNRKGKPIDPFCQIQIIDQKLNQLANEMLILHGANLNLLAKVEEINGLIIDLMAG